MSNPALWRRHNGSPLDRADLALWESRNARLPERHRRDPEPEDLAKMRLDVVAVLQAIREPSAEMLDTGGFYCIQHAGAMTAADRRQARTVFMAMIDDLLSDQESSR